MFLFLILKKININDLCRSITILLYSTTPIIYTHTFSGLETVLFSSTLLFIIYLSLIILEDKNSRTQLFILFSLVLLVFSLIRPEGIIFSLLVIFFSAFYFYSEKKSGTKKIVLILFSVFIIPYIIFFLWRWNYYNQFFPNTYYIKSGETLFSFESYNSFKELFINYLGFPLIMCLILILINIDKTWKELKNKSSKLLPKELLNTLIPAILFFIILLVQYFHSNLLMNFSHRFFLPLFPFLLILFSTILNFGYNNLAEIKSSKPLTYKANFILLIIILILHLISNIKIFKDEVLYTSKMKTLLEDIHIPAGKFINKIFDNDLTLLVHADAGAIPYFSKLRTIDFGGLNDVYLSHKAGLSEKQIVDYFFDVDADILAITSFNKNKILRKKGSLNWDTLEQTIEDERFKNFTLVKIFETDVWTYYEFIFVRNELLYKYNSKLTSYKSSF